MLVGGVQYFQTELNKRAQRKKKMRSTHACTPSFAVFFLNIHVGCCLFSHIHNSIKKFQIICGVSFFDHRMKYTATDEHQLTCTVVQNIKKNAEHTHMYTILRTLSSQYSRRLLSIVARPNQQKKIKLTKRYECLLYRL